MLFRSKDLTVYIAHGELCHCLKVSDGSQTVIAVKDLECDHEECDTRVFLHAHHAAQEHETVIIKSPDTSGATVHGFPVIRTDQPSRFGTQVILT